MVDYSNPFLTSFLGSRNQFTQPQNQFNQQQNQYDFSGWGDRLGKIEEGIAGLTKQFNNFQTPGDVAPEYTGNAAPEPLEQSANAPEPLGGIESLVAPSPKSYAPGMEPLGGMTPKPASVGAPQNTGFNFDPSGGSLMSQLSSAYGGQTHEEWGGGRGQPGFTQGFADFFTGEGYYADPRGTYADGSWNISDKPIDLGSRFGGTLDPYGNMGSAYGNNDIANISEVTRPGIHNIHDTGLLPGAPSGAQLGLPQQDKTWSPTQGWRPEQGTPPPQQAIDAHADFWRSKGLQSPGGAYTGSPEQRIALTNSLGGRPNDMAMPIGGLTQPQQQQALQVGLGALQGPTQRKIQQGIGALV